ncbi:hypothetical protein IHE45_13G069600 [Dioscorea alata]|uniref:Uncharacterized protein n=1 Tax=Dioscorea alata TaxID=55571 RepID=A0ACB7UYR3_DIOAL|nr:hypothetical protein IHE45_13G069600 [Dioscorea alata]
MSGSPRVKKPVSSLESRKGTRCVEGFSKMSRGISPSIPLVTTVGIMVLHATNLTARWSTTLTRMGSSSVGRIVAMRMRTTSLVATGGREIAAATISGCECRSSGGRRFKGSLEQLKIFCFRN